MDIRVRFRLGSSTLGLTYRKILGNSVIFRTRSTHFKIKWTLYYAFLIRVTRSSTHFKIKRTRSATH